MSDFQVAQVNQPAPTSAVQGVPSSPKQEPAQQEAPKPQMDPKFAQYAKKEKAIQAMKREAQAKEQAVAQREAEIQKKFDEITAKENRWKEDKYKAAEEAGLTYEEWTQRILANGEITPHVLKQELEEMKKLREQDRKEALDREKQAAAQYEEQVKEGFKEDLKEYTRAKASQYPLANAFDSNADDAFTVIEHIFEHGNDDEGIAPGTIVNHEYALAQVQKFYMNELQKGIKAMGYDIVPTGQARPTEQVVPKQEEQGFTPKQSSKTLTNEFNSSSVATVIKNNKSEDERIKRALARLDAR